MLMLDNCRRYNVDNYNPVRQLGEELSKQFNIHWTNFMTRRFVRPMQEEESAALAPPPPPPVKRPPEEVVESRKLSATTKKAKHAPQIRFKDWERNLSSVAEEDEARQALIEALQTQVSSHAETIQRLKEAEEFAAAAEPEKAEVIDPIVTKVRFTIPTPSPVVVIASPAVVEPKVEATEDAPPPSVAIGDYLAAVHIDFVNAEAKKRARSRILQYLFGNSPVST